MGAAGLPATFTSSHHTDVPQHLKAAGGTKQMKTWSLEKGQKAEN